MIGLIDGKLKFAMIEVAIVAVRYSPYDVLNPIYEKWRTLIRIYNSDSGTGLNKGIYTGGIGFTWMRSEKEFIISAIQGILISMTFSFIILVLSTLNIIIAFYAFISISFIVLSMTCMMQIMGWEFGIGASISVVILVGFSVDYVVHLANHYVEAAYTD
jgi:predicted RND superfamily exporter protein